MTACTPEGCWNGLQARCPAELGKRLLSTAGNVSWRLLVWPCGENDDGHGAEVNVKNQKQELQAGGPEAFRRVLVYVNGEPQYAHPGTTGYATQRGRVVDRRKPNPENAFLRLSTTVSNGRPLSLVALLRRRCLEYVYACSCSNGEIIDEEHQHETATAAAKISSLIDTLMLDEDQSQQECVDHMIPLQPGPGAGHRASPWIHSWHLNFEIDEIETLFECVLTGRGVVGGDENGIEEQDEDGLLILQRVLDERAKDKALGFPDCGLLNCMLRDEDVLRYRGGIGAANEEDLPDQRLQNERRVFGILELLQTLPLPPRPPPPRSSVHLEKMNVNDTEQKEHDVEQTKGDEDKDFCGRTKMCPVLQKVNGLKTLFLNCMTLQSRVLQFVLSSADSAALRRVEKNSCIEGCLSANYSRVTGWRTLAPRDVLEMLTQEQQFLKLTGGPSKIACRDSHRLRVHLAKVAEVLVSLVIFDRRELFEEVEVVEGGKNTTRLGAGETENLNGHRNRKNGRRRRSTLAEGYQVLVDAVASARTRRDEDKEGVANLQHVPRELAGAVALEFARHVLEVWKSGLASAAEADDVGGSTYLEDLRDENLNRPGGAGSALSIMETISTTEEDEAALATSTGSSTLAGPVPAPRGNLVKDGGGPPRGNHSSHDEEEDSAGAAPGSPPLSCSSPTPAMPWHRRQLLLKNGRYHGWRAEGEKLEALVLQNAASPPHDDQAIVANIFRAQLAAVLAYIEKSLEPRVTVEQRARLIVSDLVAALSSVEENDDNHDDARKNKRANLWRSFVRRWHPDKQGAFVENWETMGEEERRTAIRLAVVVTQEAAAVKDRFKL